jgi:hypothetical protein
MSGAPDARDVLDPERCGHCHGPEETWGFGPDGLLYCSTECLEAGPSQLLLGLFERQRRARATHKEREDRLLAEVHIEVSDRALVDRPSLGRLVDFLVGQTGHPRPHGPFVDIGSGAGNVVSYVATVFPHYFTEVHALDLVQEGSAMLEVNAMLEQVSGSAPIRWWHVDPADSSKAVNSSTHAEESSVQALLDGAAFIYSADLLFSDDAVNSYRKCIAQSLAGSPERTVFYATFHPVSRERTPWAKDRHLTCTTKETPEGTGSLHIGQYIREISVVYARKNAHVAWGDSILYLVRLVGLE